MCKHGSKAHVRLSSACRQPAATHLVVAGGVTGALGVQVPLVAVAAHLAALTAHQALDLGRGKIGSRTQLSTVVVTESAGSGRGRRGGKCFGLTASVLSLNAECPVASPWSCASLMLRNFTPH